jgi:sensor histidine kinase YesM
MKKSVVVTLHVLYWLKQTPVIALLVPGYGFINSTFLFYMVLPKVGNLLAFYSAYTVTFPYLLARKKIVGFSISSILVLVISYLAGWSLFALLNRYYTWIDLPEIAYSINKYSFEIYFSEALWGYVAGCLLKAFIHWYSDMRVREELKRKQAQAELALLKAQTNPHFLFNTLNNIDTMILKSPEKASLYLNKLSDILRFTLYESSDEKILLHTEIEYIQKYLDLQGIRSNNGKFISFQVTGDPGGLLIAPLLFMPFLENAFKHTVHTKEDRAIDIRIAIQQGKIIFQCDNLMASRRAKNEPGGLGLEIIKSRLAFYYPGHALKVSVVENRYCVSVELNG